MWVQKRKIVERPKAVSYQQVRENVVVKKVNKNLGRDGDFTSVKWNKTYSTRRDKRSHVKL